MKIAFSPIYKYTLPETHRFPMIKYELIPEQLLLEGTITDSDLFHPGLLEKEVALLTHTEEYWRKMTTCSFSKKEERLIGFPISPAFAQRARHITQGTIECTEHALRDGVALNIAGGTHHAFANHGEGYCCFNDQAVASNYLINKGLASKILIVDLDVHQGNGSAHIFHDNPNVFTFSMHGEKNYPHRKQESSLDIGLPCGMEDAAYLHILKENLPRIADEFEPDFVFFQSGVDILESDRLGRLAVSRAGCMERDRFVFDFCKKNNIPVVASMGGGYSDRLADIVEAHANTYRMAAEVFF